MESQINLLLFVLSVVSTSGGQQGTHCQVFPSNYTFPTSHIRNAGISGFLEVNNCTTNPPFTTCPHPSVLTDSNTGGDTFHVAQYLEWTFNNEFSQLLFTFSTVVDLEFGRVYYYFDPRNIVAVITLEFLAVPDDFTLATTTPPHSTSLHNATTIVIDLGQNIYIPLSTTTRKLLVIKRGGQLLTFAISEVEFYSVCETTTTSTSSTIPSEVTDPLRTSSYTDTLPSDNKTMGTDSPNSSHTDTPSSTLTTDAGVENKATSTDSLTIVGYIIASVAMVWMMVLTGVVLVNLYYIMYFYK